MIVADTHALIWWMTRSPEISSGARSALSEADVVGVPIIVCWEVAMLARRGRIQLRVDVTGWLEEVAAAPAVTLLPLNLHICVTAANLSDAIRDPADRLIVATALHQGVPLVTKDHRIRASGIVETLW